MKTQFLSKLMVIFGIVTLSLTTLSSCGTENGGSNVEALRAFCAVYFGVGGDDTMGYIGGTEGRLIRSTDGGNTFENVDSGIDYGIKDITFSSDGTYGYAVGGMGNFLRSADGGQSWTSEMIGSDDLNGIAWNPTNQQEGWAVGNGGTIYYTGDRGSNWTMQNSGTTEDLYGVCFSSNKKGWAVGANGTILDTDDGENWTEKDSGVSVSLRYCFRDDFFGLTVGGGGTILQTNNDGDNWNAQDSGTTNDLYDIRLKPGLAGNALVVGDGVVLKTENFGNVWSVVLDEAIAGFQLFLKRLSYLSSGRAFAVGSTTSDFEEDLILRSEDDGDTWVQVNLSFEF